MITKERALQILENLDDYSRMEVSVKADRQVALLRQFIEQPSVQVPEGWTLELYRDGYYLKAPDEKNALYKRLGNYKETLIGDLFDAMLNQSQEG